MEAMSYDGDPYARPTAPPPPPSTPPVTHQGQWGYQPGPGEYQQRREPDSQARLIGWLILGTAVLTIVAAFLPWITISGKSFSGVGNDDNPDSVRDGALTIFFAIAPAVLGLLRGLGKAMLGCAIVALVLGVLITLVGAVDIPGVSDHYVDASVGIGLWITTLCGIAMAVLGIVGIVKRR